MRRPVKKVRNDPEGDLQKSIIEYATNNLPGIQVAHVPNGGKRNIKEAIRFKSLGVLPGMPDLVLWTTGGRQGWIELKAPGRKDKTTNSQKERINNFRECRNTSGGNGQPSGFCRHFERMEMDLGVNFTT